ncbi:MAG: hypothetical protein HC860_15465 [Alkalinema sp. RU_4_3]|nr:hypothetical protein [Alkalinema sp. RU_4_3]
MKCKEVIWKILAVLDQESKSVQNFLTIDRDCVQSLIELDKSCDSSLAEIAKDLLKNAVDEQNEYKLQVIIRSLINREQSEAFELTRSALESIEASDKETYINYFCELGDSRAVPHLINFLARYELVNSTDQREDDLISFTKEAILQLEEA